MSDFVEDSEHCICPVSGEHTRGRAAVDPSFFLSRWQHQLTADTRFLVLTCIFEALTKLLGSRSVWGWLV